MRVMDLLVETTVPDLGDLPFADLGRYTEADVLARLLDEPSVPAARFQSSI